MARKKLTEEEKIALQNKKNHERMENNLKFDLENYLLRKDRYLNPTRTFKVGDSWSYKNEEGTERNSKITEVYENGLFYRLESWGIRKVSRSLVQYENECCILSWLDLNYDIESENKNVFCKKNTFNLQFFNFSVESLISRHYHSGIEFNPFYQRGEVWSQEDKEFLFDSIFNNIDIGKFVFIKDDTYKNKNIYEIVDGKQRMTTLIDFYEDRITYRGLYFSQLSNTDKNHILNYLCSVGDTNSINNVQKKELFIRLNTAGKTMSKNHINKVREMEVPSDDM